MYYDVVIIGGGAAGLMCALEAGKRGRTVLVVERTKRVGNKILISGGGRCNFTNRNMSYGFYESQNPHFCKSALARFQPEDFVSLVERHGIAYHEKKAGQLFCNDSAKQIVDMFLQECETVCAQILTECPVLQIKREEVFRVGTACGEFECESLVIATGGLSYANLGATDFGYRAATQFGIRTIPVRPGLTPLIFNPDERDKYCKLTGVSIDVEVNCGAVAVREHMLFTHRGLSGPAILTASLYWKSGDPILIDLLPEEDALQFLSGHREITHELSTVLGKILPKRFVELWLSENAPSKPLCRYSKEELELTAYRLKNWRIYPAGTEGYDTAEVTSGGVDTKELSSKTMEVKTIPGLYFIGEIVDMTGQLGGYNLHWAWASGFAAGQYV